MRRLVPIAVVFLALVGGCAVQSARRGPGAPAGQGGAVAEDADGTRSLEDWEALIQFHESRIAQLEPELESEVGTTPARPGPPPSVTETPAEERPRAARRLGVKDSSLLCQRACRHVQAICYAATRICAIADRLRDDRSRRSCVRARLRCRRARETAGRRCGPCGKSSRRQCRRRVHG